MSRLTYDGRTLLNDYHREMAELEDDERRDAEDFELEYDLGDDWEWMDDLFVMHGERFVDEEREADREALTLEAYLQQSFAQESWEEELKEGMGEEVLIAE